MDSEDKKYNIQQNDNYTVIKVLVEKLDTNIAPALKSELVLIAGNGEKNMIIDLSECRYCDSSGLSAILVANRLCKNSRGTFVLTGLQTAVERLITISQLDTVLNIKDNIEDSEHFIMQEITKES
ncbi:MAG: STAS domain-containing protein [Bacteroidales bacterium]|nr:STAS domain-containing protein [Bacteroidales bacterium]MBN2757325.1 STAS domain-containing protein [Bacteroidales bacterium]